MADDRAELDRLRERIHALDRELVSLVDERRTLVLQVGRLKGKLGPFVIQAVRWGIKRALGV